MEINTELFFLFFINILHDFSPVEKLTEKKVSRKIPEILLWFLFFFYVMWYNFWFVFPHIQFTWKINSNKEQEKYCESKDICCIIIFMKLHHVEVVCRLVSRLLRLKIVGNIMFMQKLNTTWCVKRYFCAMLCYRWKSALCKNVQHFKRIIHSK